MPELAPLRRIVICAYPPEHPARTWEWLECGHAFPVGPPTNYYPPRRRRCHACRLGWPVPADPPPEIGGLSREHGPHHEGPT
jgi:hypothetical protein